MTSEGLYSRVVDEKKVRKKGKEGKKKCAARQVFAEKGQVRPPVFCGGKKKKRKRYPCTCRRLTNFRRGEKSLKDKGRKPGDSWQGRIRTKHRMENCFFTTSMGTEKGRGGA